MDGWILYQVAMVVEWLALTSHSMSMWDLSGSCSILQWMWGIAEYECEQLSVCICWSCEELPTRPGQKAVLAQRQL